MLTSRRAGLSLDERPECRLASGVLSTDSWRQTKNQAGCNGLSCCQSKRAHQLKPFNSAITHHTHAACLSAAVMFAVEVHAGAPTDFC